MTGKLRAPWIACDVDTAIIQLEERRAEWEAVGHDVTGIETMIAEAHDPLLPEAGALRPVHQGLLVELKSWAQKTGVTVVTSMSVDATDDLPIETQLPDVVLYVEHDECRVVRHPRWLTGKVMLGQGRGHRG